MTQDEVLQQDVCNALGREEELETSTIGVAVRDGIVHLLGSVPTQADSDEAETVCRNVRNVAGVVNELHVEHGPRRARGVTA